MLVCYCSLFAPGCTINGSVAVNIFDTGWTATSTGEMANKPSGRVGDMPTTRVRI
jgi:isoaspartyl peptidase/L-asparaginase-like protein (Ntn-hydrolase superfamily)